jgi:hypothetical protein
MSKAVKRIFKGVKKVVSKTASFIKTNWKTIALGAAALFTAGAALGYVGANAAGGLAFSGFGSSGVGAFGGAVATKGVGAAWSALGTTVKAALTGNLSSVNAAAAESITAAQTAAPVLSPTGNVLGAGNTLSASGGAPGLATPTPAGAVDMTAKAAGRQLTEQMAGEGLLNSGLGKVTEEAAKTGLKGWAGKQSMGDWAQLGGLGLATYGALKEGDEDVPDYALEGDHRYVVEQQGAGRAALMQPKYRSTSAGEQAKKRYRRWMA